MTLTQVKTRMLKACDDTPSTTRLLSRQLHVSEEQAHKALLQLARDRLVIQIDAKRDIWVVTLKARKLLSKKRKG